MTDTLLESPCYYLKKAEIEMEIDKRMETKCRHEWPFPSAGIAIHPNSDKHTHVCAHIYKNKTCDESQARQPISAILYMPKWGVTRVHAHPNFFDQTPSFGARDSTKFWRGRGKMWGWPGINSSLTGRHASNSKQLPKTNVQ